MTNKVRISRTSILEMANRADKNRLRKDVVYEFSNARKFEDSGAQGGPYAHVDEYVEPDYVEPVYVSQ